MHTLMAPRAARAHTFPRSRKLRWITGLALATLLGASAAANAAGQVVISQVYGGGGNAGATLTNDFVELHNNTNAPVSVDGWSVQYGSATGTTQQVTRLAGAIPAGGYYLVQEALVRWLGSFADPGCDRHDFHVRHSGQGLPRQ